MAWAPIRKATDEDRETLRRKAAEFCARHGIEDHWDDPVDCVEFLVCEPWHYKHDTARLRKLWRRIVARALGSGAEGIGYGSVGYSVKG